MKFCQVSLFFIPLKCVVGILQLREQIVKFHKRYDDLELDPDQVIVGPGTKELIFLMLNVFKGGVHSCITIFSKKR